MMKLKFLFLAILSLTLFSFTAMAQTDERLPGIYAVVDGVSTPLDFQYSTGSSRPYHGKYKDYKTSVLEPGIGGFRFKGMCSGVLATDTLVLVVDPEEKLGYATSNEYNYFIQDLTPDWMVILPLVINGKKQRREFERGMVILAFGNGNESGGVQFDWKRISDNSFEIKLPKLGTGEYGVFFRTNMDHTYLLHYMFGFTIHGQELK